MQEQAILEEAGGGKADAGNNHGGSYATNGEPNGGAGGKSVYCNVGNLGGAGNPGTDGASDGTGGLLIIACNNLINNKGIEAKGAYGSGGSGGGSINIFYTGSYENGENSYVSAAGGSGSGIGGTGTITIGSIASGYYENTYSNYEYSREVITITFDANDENGTTKEQKTLKGLPTRLQPCTFTKEGYAFNVWQQDSIQYVDGQVVTLNEDVTLVAQWVADSFEIKYHNNDETITTKRVPALINYLAYSEQCDSERTSEYIRISSYDKSGANRGGQVQLVIKNINMKNYSTIKIRSKLSYYGGYSSYCNLVLPNGTTQRFFIRIQ